MFHLMPQTPCIWVSTLPPLQATAPSKSNKSKKNYAVHPLGVGILDLENPSNVILTSTRYTRYSTSLHSSTKNNLREHWITLIGLTIDKFPSDSKICWKCLIVAPSNSFFPFIKLPSPLDNSKIAFTYLLWLAKWWKNLVF